MSGAKKTIKIKRICVMPVAKVMAFIYGVAFFALAAIVVMIDAVAGDIADNIMFDMAMLIGLPLFYGLLAGVVFGIMAAIYNFAASKMGGIEIETE